MKPVLNPAAVAREHRYHGMDPTSFRQGDTWMLPVLNCWYAGGSTLVSRIFGLGMSFPGQQGFVTHGFVTGLFLICLCYVQLHLAGAVLASPLTETEAVKYESQVSVQKATHSPWIWFDELGAKEITKQMLSLAQDLGLNHRGESSEADTSLVSRSELDTSYSRIFIAMLREITRTRGDEVILTPEALKQASADGRLALLVEDILPRQERAVRLRQKIRDYRQLTAYVWPALPEMYFKLGQRAPEIAKLRWMLTQLGDLPPKQMSGYRDAIFDPSITQGITHFQRRHGLTITGEWDEQTRHALNKTPAERIIEMQRTLLRWFEFPSYNSRSYLWINLPSFSLDVVEGESSVLNMRVIVGKPSTPTPQLLTELTQITVNPTWTPPVSIVYRELLPKNSEEPGYLASNGFELRKLAAGESRAIDPGLLSRQQLTRLLSEYQLVQEPGRNNALGTLRFSIPNTDDIYLHDTPVKSLFKRKNRAISHGCVRLENAKGLLNYLLSEQVLLQSSAIQTAMEQASPRHFRLPQPLPVIMTYHTVWVDEAGLLQFRPDVYRLN